MRWLEKMHRQRSIVYIMSGKTANRAGLLLANARESCGNSRDHARFPPKAHQSLRVGGVAQVQGQRRRAVCRKNKEKGGRSEQDASAEAGAMQDRDRHVCEEVWREGGQGEPIAGPRGNRDGASSSLQR